MRIGPSPKSSASRRRSYATLQIVGEPYLQKSGREFSPRGALPGAAKVQGWGFLHPCFKEDCKASAPFGYGVSLKRGKLGTWACAGHRTELQSQMDGHATKVEEHQHQHAGDGNDHRKDDLTDLGQLGEHPHQPAHGDDKNDDRGDIQGEFLL